MKAIRAIQKLSFPFETQSPFLFAVYHRDKYPVGSPNTLGIPGVVGNGADFEWSAPYRMYHGEDVPGFPSHPHRGFATITLTMDGESEGFETDRNDGVVDHSDSLGNGARYGLGDVQWMTAGGGIVHSEMFPLVNTDRPNHTKFFQLWINMPAKNKLVPPNFVMHWAENIQRSVDLTAGHKVTVWAGEFNGIKGQPPPPHDWAADEDHDVTILLIILRANGGKVHIPASKIGTASNRRLYFHEGVSEKIVIEGQSIPMRHSVTLDASVPFEIVNDGDIQAELLLLQGKPIDEPVVSHGPFVMNTRSEIVQAFSDYQATRFGGWPWSSDAPTFPREKGRFTLVNGVEQVPPTVSK